MSCPMADLDHATENDTDLHGDLDARHWAERFASKFQVTPRSYIGNRSIHEPVDVAGLMLAWFASAIETGRMMSRVVAVRTDRDRDKVIAGLRDAGIPDPEAAYERLIAEHEVQVPSKRILPEFDHILERQMSEMVHVALGAASVCWEPMDCTGVFDSRRAEQIGAELMAAISRFTQCCRFDVPEPQASLTGPDAETERGRKL